MQQANEQREIKLDSQQTPAGDRVEEGHKEGKEKEKKKKKKKECIGVEFGVTR